MFNYLGRKNTVGLFCLHNLPLKDGSMGYTMEIIFIILKISLQAKYPIRIYTFEMFIPLG